MEGLMKMFFPGTNEHNIHVGESYALWTQLQAWYDVAEFTGVALKDVTDAELRFLLEQGLGVMNKNISKLEETLARLRVSPPPRPPKTPDKPRDELIYRLVFDMTETALTFDVKAVNICTNDDSLRRLFIDVLCTEAETYDSLVKFGKKKGWVHHPPSFKPS